MLPAFAHPQIAASVFCCSTMLSEKNAGSFIVAETCRPNKTNNNNRTEKRFRTETDNMIKNFEDRNYLFLALAVVSYCKKEKQTGGTMISDYHFLF